MSETNSTSIIVSQKKLCICLSKNSSIQNICDGNVENSFHNPAKKFLPESNSSSLNVRKWQKNLVNFPGKKLASECSSGHVKGCLHNPDENFFRERRIFFAKSPKKVKKNNFSKKINFLKMFLWTRAMHFWKPCKKCVRKPKTFHALFEKTLVWKSSKTFCR